MECFTRSWGRILFGFMVLSLLGCFGGLTCETTGDRPAVPPLTITPTVFERGKEERTMTTGRDAYIETANPELSRALMPDFVLPLESVVTVPATVPLGAHSATMGFRSTDPKQAGLTLFVLDASQPAMVHLVREPATPDSGLATLATIVPPGPTTLEFVLPTGLSVRMLGGRWTDPSSPVDLGTDRKADIAYGFDGEIAPGDYPYTLRWRSASSVLAEATGTIRVVEAVNRIAFTRQQMGASINSPWSFPASSITRRTVGTGLEVVVQDAGRTLTLRSDRPLEAGTVFVPYDVRLTYSEGGKEYTGSYGYLVVEELTASVLRIRLREMSMMAAEGTPQGYFTLEGILDQRLN